MAVSETRRTARESSRGSTAAFQPYGSPWPERSPASSARVAGVSSPTPRAHVSPRSATSRCSVSLERSAASVGVASSVPSRVA